MSDTVEKNGSAKVLNKDTLVPLGIVAACIFAVAGGVTWLNRSLSSIDFQLQAIQRDVGELQRRTESGWRTRDMISWCRLLQAQNPDIRVPEPK